MFVCESTAVELPNLAHKPSRGNVSIAGNTPAKQKETNRSHRVLKIQLSFERCGVKTTNAVV